MRSLLAALAIISLSATASSASDKSFWEGPYLGISAGVNVDTSTYSYTNDWTNGIYYPPHAGGVLFDPGLFDPLLDPYSLNARWPSSLANSPAFSGGLQFGYIKERAPGDLIGVELGLYRSFGESSWDSEKSVDIPGDLPVHLSTDERLSSSTATLALAKLKLGKATENWAVFLTGGPALANIKTAAHAEYDRYFTCGDCHENSNTSWKRDQWKFGYNVGVSAETKIDQKNTMKVDFSYFDFGKLKPMSGTEDYTEGSTSSYAAPPIKTQSSGYTIQFGINHRF